MSSILWEIFEGAALGYFIVRIGSLLVRILWTITGRGP